MNGPVTSKMLVSDIIERYPETIEVFLAYGCPDMSKGVFRVMCRAMRLRWAAAVHRIPLASLLADLNQRVMASRPPA